MSQGSRAKPTAVPKPRVTRKRGYHHPDLRRALLDAAIRTLIDDDVSAVTMQRLARLAGVSAAAPYHHFGDLEILLAELATEGWLQWAERAAIALGTHADAHAQLLAMADAWLTFTSERPAHYKVMLLPQLGDRERFATMHDASGRSLVLLFEVIGRALPGEARGDLAARVVLIWSALHGFTILRAGGILDNVPPIPASSAVAPEVLRRLIVSVLAE